MRELREGWGRVRVRYEMKTLFFPPPLFLFPLLFSFLFSFYLFVYLFLFSFFSAVGEKHGGKGGCLISSSSENISLAACWIV